MELQDIAKLGGEYLEGEFADLTRVQIQRVPDRAGSIVNVVFGDEIVPRARIYVVKKYIENEREIAKEIPLLVEELKKLVFGVLGEESLGAHGTSENVGTIYRIKEL